MTETLTPIAPEDQIQNQADILAQEAQAHLNEQGAQGQPAPAPEQTLPNPQEFGRHASGAVTPRSEYVEGGRHSAPQEHFLYRGATRLANFMEGRRTTAQYTREKVAGAQEKVAKGRTVARGIGLTVLDGAVDIKNDFKANVSELRDSVREDRRARATKAEARKEARIEALISKRKARGEEKMLSEAYKMNDKFDSAKVKSEHKVENAAKRQERRAAVKGAAKTIGKGALIGFGITPAYKVAEFGAKSAAKAGRATAEYSREKASSAKYTAKAAKDAYHYNRATAARAKLAKHESSAKASR